jgi:hypothetical protein
MGKINKFLKENRSLRFLGILFILGTIGIAIMTIINDTSIFTITEEETQPVVVVNGLQNEINTFENKSNWNLADYNLCVSNINTSEEAHSISAITKGNLVLKLNKVFEQKIFQRCEAYLTSRRSDNPNDLKVLLNTLLNLVASHSQINFYKAQIDKYVYYEKTLPTKIKSFTVFNYDDDAYNNYLSEVENMPGFYDRYKNHSKFRGLSQILKEKLDRINYDFYNP